MTWVAWVASLVAVVLHLVLVLQSLDLLPQHLDGDDDGADYGEDDVKKMVIMTMVIMVMVMGPLPQHLDGVALHLPQLPLLFKSCSRVPQLLAQLLCVRLQPDDDDDDDDAGGDDSMVMTMMLVMFVYASNLMFLSSSLTSRTWQNQD